MHLLLWTVLLSALASLCGAELMEEEEQDPTTLFNFTSLEVKYQRTSRLLSPSSTAREFRRGIQQLEEVALGQGGHVGRISADALADLAYLHLFGSNGRNALTQSPGKAFLLANQSAHFGSPKGRHLMAFLLRIGIGIPGIPGMVDTEAASWNMELLAAEQNYLPAMMSVAYRYMFHLNDCDSSLRLYRAAATTAVAWVDATFYGDYASLRPLSAQADELGDDLFARLARDAETMDYWLFHAERKEPRALFEVGKMYQLGQWGVAQDLPAAVDYFRRAAAEGHVGAQGELGRLLTIGHGCELNLGAALKLLRLAVGAQQKQDEGSAVGAGAGGEGGSRGSSERVAAATLGSLLMRRVFESEDAELGARYLRQAAAAGSDDAEWELGQAELRDGRLDAALHHFQRAERRDHVRSLLALAQLHESSIALGGLGGGRASPASASSGSLSSSSLASVAASSTQHAACRAAVKLYKRVAEVGPWLDGAFGPRQAMRELRAGRESEALLLYLLAAGEGYSIAHYNAAWMLARNKGTGSSGVSGLAITASATALKYKKHSLALQLLQIVSAMQPAHSWASLLEGDLHRRGSGTHRNLTASALCYERGVLAENALAMERLAVQMMHGSGVRQDDKRAVQLLKLALACAGREGSGMRGLAVVVKKAELVLRLALLRFTGLLRSLLSGRWIARLLKRGGGAHEPAGRQEEQSRQAEQEQEKEQDQDQDQVQVQEKTEGVRQQQQQQQQQQQHQQEQVQVQVQEEEQEDAEKSSSLIASAVKGKPMPLGLSHLLARAMEGSANKDKQ